MLILLKLETSFFVVFCFFISFLQICESICARAICIHADLHQNKIHGRFFLNLFYHNKFRNKQMDKRNEHYISLEQTKTE